MQNTFTQKMQALRASMEATNHARRQFLSGLRANVSDLRDGSRDLLARLHAGHRAATRAMQASLSVMREQRRELNRDLRRGGVIFRSART
jgi:hypothetical protein